MAYTTLRMHDPVYEVSGSWSFEKLNPQILKMLNRLSHRYQSGTIGENLAKKLLQSFSVFALQGLFALRYF